MKDDLFFIIEFKGKEDMDHLLFSEILMTSKRCNPNAYKTNCRSVKRPKIFIQSNQSNVSCYEELLTEIGFSIAFKKVVLFSIEGASKTVYDVIAHFENNKFSRNLSVYFINPSDSSVEKCVDYKNVSTIKTKYYFSDCGDIQSEKKKRCICENNKNAGNIEWVSIQKNTFAYGYSITILRELIFENYLHAF